MKSKHILSRRRKIFASAAIFAAGLFLLVGNLNGATVALGCPVAARAKEVLETVALGVALQILQACILDFRGLTLGITQALFGLWCLLFVLAIAGLLRAAFASKVGSQPARRDSFENR
ncbi:MAG: hypothetical protein ABSG16_08655 [Candidatus Acidiferrum sp.]|jgi:hypothetical protein